MRATTLRGLSKLFLGLLLEANEGARLCGSLLSAAHAQIVSSLPAQTIEHGVSGQAEDEAVRVVLAP
jgi:hypothetical protein